MATTDRIWHTPLAVTLFHISLQQFATDTHPQTLQQFHIGTHPIMQKPKKKPTVFICEIFNNVSIPSFCEIFVKLWEKVVKYRYAVYSQNKPPTRRGKITL